MEYIYKGIDTSKWQSSKVDYFAAKKAGYDFVILRVGCSSTKDSCFEKDYAAAVAAGMKVGVYYYTYSTTVAEANNDANRVLNWLNNRHLDLPVAYDVEDAKQKSSSRKTVNSEMYNKFSSVVKSNGYDCMLYTGENFFNNYFNKVMITDKLWIAKYSSKEPNVGKDIYMWQYTSDAFSNDFYKNKLDRNYMYCTQQIITPTVKEKNPYQVPTRTLKKTSPIMQGEDVKWLQWELIQAGCLSEKNSKGTSNIDGKFGNDTKTALLKYQKLHKLTQDGKCGSKTRAAMQND